MFLFLVFSALALPGQVVDEGKKMEIMQEGYLMFRLELASWQTVDRLRGFLSEGKEKGLAGYLTYPDGEAVRSIFYSAAEPPEILATVSFDKEASPGSLVVDSTKRGARLGELLRIRLREAALENIRNDDAFYALYKHTGMSLVILPGEKVHKVYFMIVPQIRGVVLFGNDYLLEFDAEMQLVKREKLHNDLIQMVAVGEDESPNGRITSHQHGTGESVYMTATDVCTLMLYGQVTDWVGHRVFSPEFVSTWDMEYEKLIIVNRKTFEQIVNSDSN